MFVNMGYEQAPDGALEKKGRKEMGVVGRVNGRNELREIPLIR